MSGLSVNREKPLAKQGLMPKSHLSAFWERKHALTLLPQGDQVENAFVGAFVGNVGFAYLRGR